LPDPKVAAKDDLHKSVINSAEDYASTVEASATASGKGGVLK